MKLLISGAIGALALMNGGFAQAADAISPAFEVRFALPAADTLRTIADGCVRDEETVTSRNGDGVTCEIPLGRPERIAARIVLREPFTPSPRAFVRFVVAPAGATTSTVEVSGWVEDSRTPDVRRRANMAGRRFDVRLQAFLIRLGGRPTSA